jgi:putative YphP/YqiW family bacilliredoxin
MPYPEPLVAPMRAELTSFGVEELRTADEVDQVFADANGKTMLLIVNSVCGCAAANARPAVRMALQSAAQPDRMVTVFAGQDLEATFRARQYLAGIPPSSPFMALLQDGDPVFVLERRHIEGRSASAIATDLVGAYQKFCGSGDGASLPSGQTEASKEAPEDLPSTFRSIL